MRYLLPLPRAFVLTLLACIYILGFILSPYWILYKTTAASIWYLAVTILAGLIWLRRIASSFELAINRKDIKLFFLLLPGVLLLNYRPLRSVIPFRGDEALHIERTLELVTRLPVLETFILVCFFLSILLYSLFIKQRWMILAGVFLIGCIVTLFLVQNSFEGMKQYPQFFLRYPFINYWLFAVFPKLASLVNPPYHEFLYRIIPLLSMVGTAWVYQKNLGLSSGLSSVAWGFAVATIPLIFYYSSILYLEPAAVFLMTIVCLDIHTLLHRSNRDISKVPSWYALILIGFVKETTIPFLLGFSAVRMIVQWRVWSQGTLSEKSETSLVSLLAKELAILFVLLLPAGLYVYFRTTLTSTRSFTPEPSNLFHLTNYYFILLSFVEQFGIVFIFFIAGCVLMIKDREFSSLFAYLTLIFGTLAFHMMDYEVYAGYSRFNLFVFPPLLAGSAKFIRWITPKKPWLGNMLVALALLSNLLLSPVNLDGAKVPYWGTRRVDTSEHYYPYQDALLWLKTYHPQKRMLFTGIDFYYPFQFYWNKLDWKPRRDGIRSEENIDDEAIALLRILEKAEHEQYSVVVYRVIDKDFVLPEERGGFRTQIIQNSVHTLIIFYKP